MAAESKSGLSQSWPAVGGTAVVGLVIAAIVGRTAAPESVPGLPSSDLITQWGLLFTRLATDLTAITVIGLLLAPALLLPNNEGQLDEFGRRCVRLVSGLALLWSGLSLVQLVFTYSNFVPKPLSESFNISELSSFVSAITQARALVITAIVAFFVGRVAMNCRGIRGTTWALVLAVAALIPGPMTGHSASADSHDLATMTLTVHVVFATFWIGGLIALFALIRNNAPNIERSLPRFSKLALWCAIAVGISGVINASLRIDNVSQLFTTRYGALVFAKVVGFTALVWIGSRHRRGTLAKLADRASMLLFARLAAVELMVMTATVGIAVALSRTAPPGVETPLPTRARELLGFNMPPEPTVANVVFSLQPDAFIITIAAISVALYLVGVRRLNRLGRSWSPWRTAIFVGAWAIAVFSTSSGVGRYSHVLFSVHMLDHMVLSMVVPLMLVIGSPVTLALRSLPSAHSRGGDNGPRELLVAALESRPARVLTNPAVAGAIFIASFYFLYFTPLFGIAMQNHYGHLLMEAHFLASGFLFFWAIIGDGQASATVTYPLRLMLLFMAMAFHGFFGLALVSTTKVIASDYYTQLARPWGVSLLHDQHLGAAYAWALGELPITIVGAAMLVRWVQADERAAREHDAMQSSTQ